jgi:bifunctional DNA-binding transcriptional regulator/antitoxin component of YhaV-PrlF toxin-antitoxin module
VVTSGDSDARVALLEGELRALRLQLEALASEETVVLNDERVLQEVGIYRYHHPLETAAAYRDRLTDLSERIATLVKSDRGIQKSEMFTYDGSLAKGRKMTSDLGRLMLRAYNAEADNSVRTLRVGNVVTAKKRLEASRTAIAKLGRMMEMRITDEFHALRLEEIELTADFVMKKQEEKEEAREERARLREERKVAMELAAERERLDKERSHIVNAIQKLQATGGNDAELELRLAELDAAIAQNDYRAANIRAGYVYVISNRGAFGDSIIKIGLTRRLEPLDRINELGGASVPFRFDVHALFFSEDAVGLEAELHHHFADRRLNCVNTRKEFFFATPAEVREVLEAKVGNLLEFAERVEATEFLQSLRYWPEGRRQPRGS